MADINSTTQLQNPMPGHSFSKLPLGPDEGRFLLITDLHVDIKYDTGGGFYGDRQRDSSPALVDFMMDQARRQLPKPDFIVWTGDTPAHKQYTKEELLKTMKKGVEGIKQRFGDTLVIPVVGNHDMRNSKAGDPSVWILMYIRKFLCPLKQNVGYATSIGDDEDKLGLYEDIFDLWKEWIGDDPKTKETFLRGGYYRFKSSFGAEFLVLNTNIYYESNSATFKNSDDPTEQFAFIKKELNDVKQKNDSIHILAHIPPGAYTMDSTRGTITSPEMEEIYNKKLLDLFIEFASCIGWMFFGHLHTDTFRIIKDPKTGAPIQRMFLNPAITPYSQINNPAFRIFHYNKTNFDLIDIKTHYVDLDLLNKEGNKTETKLEYSMRQAYDLQSLDANSLNGLAERMATDQKLFDQYIRYRTVMHNPSELKPNRAVHLCTIGNVDLDQLDKCKLGNQ